jgi:hypothetical protein
VQFDVIRYFAASRGAMPFQRTAVPGLTVVGRVESHGESIVLDSAGGLWEARVDESVMFPMGRVDDVFLHVG